MKALRFVGLLLPLSLPAAATPVEPTGVPVILHGACTPQSMVGYGSSDADLDRHGSSFRCDTAIVTMFSRERALIQFAQKGDKLSRLVGFGGTSLGDGQMSVDHLYLNDGRILEADSGHCFINATPEGFRSFTCGARVERGEIAVAAVVGFKVGYASPKRR